MLFRSLLYGPRFTGNKPTFSYCSRTIDIATALSGTGSFLFFWSLFRTSHSHCFNGKRLTSVYTLKHLLQSPFYGNIFMLCGCSHTMLQPPVCREEIHFLHIVVADVWNSHSFTGKQFTEANAFKALLWSRFHWLQIQFCHCRTTPVVSTRQLWSPSYRKPVRFHTHISFPFVVLLRLKSLFSLASTFELRISNRFNGNICIFASTFHLRLPSNSG